MEINFLSKVKLLQNMRKLLWLCTHQAHILKNIENFKILNFLTVRNWATNSLQTPRMILTLWTLHKTKEFSDVNLQIYFSIPCKFWGGIHFHSCKILESFLQNLSGEHSTLVHKTTTFDLWLCKFTSPFPSKALCEVLDFPKSLSWSFQSVWEQKRTISRYLPKVFLAFFYFGGDKLANEGRLRLEKCLTVLYSKVFLEKIFWEPV